MAICEFGDESGGNKTGFYCIYGPLKTSIKCYLIVQWANQKGEFFVFFGKKINTKSGVIS